MIFVSDPLSWQKPNAVVAHVSRAVDKSELLKQIADGLGFPEYFGHNWDALEECLNDLSWSKAADVVIIHDDIPHLSEEDFRIYMEILRSASRNWRRGDAHTLTVVFPSEAEAR